MLEVPVYNLDGQKIETLINTVRNVGYRFVLPPKESLADRENA